LRDRAMFELAYACGLRAEELVSLGGGDVDHDGEQLRVEGKGGKARYGPRGEIALKAVGEYVQRGRPRLVGSAGEAGAGACRWAAANVSAQRHRDTHARATAGPTRVEARAPRHSAA